MNTVIILLGLSISFAIAAPTADVNEIRKLPALDHEEIHDEYGQYTLRYVTAEGTIVTETGRLVPNPDGIGFVMVVEGEVTYVGDDGKIYSTKYTSGFDGYKPVGDHIPVAPPMPPVDTVMPLVESVMPPVESSVPLSGTSKAIVVE